MSNMYDMTEGTFTNFVGNSELRGEVDRSEKEPLQRGSLAGWETGPTRSTQGLTRIHVQPHIRFGSSGWHTQQCRLGSDWMRCISASPGQQRALAAGKASVSQAASAIAQPADGRMWGCPAQPGLC